MSRRRYAFLSVASNTVVARRPGSLYSIHGTAAVGTIRVDDSHSFPQGVLDVNASSSNTIGHLPLPARFDGLGFNTGLVVAFASNAGGVTVEYDTF